MINEVYSVHGMSFSNPTKEDLALSGYTTRVRLPGAVYHPDGSVEFTLFAPEAEHVEVSGMPGSSMGEEKIPLKKTEDGYWTAVVKGLPKRFHYVTFWGNGNEILNSRMNLGVGYGRVVNYIDIPDPEKKFVEIQDVPHGTIRCEFWESQVLKKTVRCMIYTPPGYDTSEESYPVLYLQHGGGENETAWFWHGHLNWILDNLIAQKLVSPMLVVCSTGYAIDENGQNGSMAVRSEFLMRDIIPSTEKYFRVKTGSAYRAIAGLSMGSQLALFTAVRYLKEFSYVGIFSGSLLPDTARDAECAEMFRRLENASAVNQAFRLLFFSFGLDEEGKKAEWQKTQERMERCGVRVLKHSCYPGKHEWSVWRNSIFEFLQQCFL